MKKSLLLSYGVLLTCSLLLAQTPKVVGDCTVTYDVVVNGEKSGTAAKMTKTLYVKGFETRTDLASPGFFLSTIHNGKTGATVVLREVSNDNKYMTILDSAGWKDQNKKFEGMTVTLLSESKTILGYECKKATVKLKDGTILNMFYATGIKPSYNENEYQFKGIPGFVLEYESQADTGKKITFKANKINLDPVPASKFEIPKTGYRIIP